MSATEKILLWGETLKVTDDVKIAGVTYTINLCKDLISEEECFGKADFGHSRIKLDEGMSSEMKNATLLHEIIEVINSENSLKLKHQQIQCLATQLYQVIIDNQEMFQND